MQSSAGRRPLRAATARQTTAVALALLTIWIGALAAHGPIAQDPAYHRFADTRAVLGIPNGLNVLSNIPFLVVGLLGLRRLARLPTASPMSRGERRAAALLCAAIAGVAAGSAWYHLAPDSGRLVWDRLPMSLAFASITALVAAERLGRGALRWLLPALVLAGVGSVVLWHLGELQGAGDLRAYATMQFFPALLLPLLLWLRPAVFSSGPLLMSALCLYGLAKICELGDAAVFATSGMLSGHTVKHLVAGLACWLLVEATVALPAVLQQP